MRSKYSVPELIDGFMLLGINLFFLYSFWYHHAVREVSGAFTVIGLLLLILCLFRIYRPNYYKELGLFLAFFALTAINSILFSKFRSMSVSTLTTCLQYMIPMIAIFTYIDGNSEKLRKVLWSIILAITLLSISIYLNPSVQLTGAVTIGALNVNVLSSYLVLALIATIALLSDQRTLRMQRVILLAEIVILAMTEINAASRRGFIVFVICLIMALLFHLHIKYAKQPFTKWITIGALFFVGIMVVGLFLDSFGDSILLLRLSGHRADVMEGDRLRKVYQATALQLFLSNPLFGAGLNSVALSAGNYSHSLYYELLGCTGIIGFILMIWFWIGHGIRLFRIYNKKKNEDPQIAYLSTAGVILVISTLLSGYAVVMIYDMYYYVLIGLIAAVVKIVANLIETTEIAE